jgi:hypothetical protein
MKIIDRIVLWRGQGHNVRRIWSWLLEHKVRTADGKEWSHERIRVAYHAEVVRRAAAEPSAC